MNKQEIKALYNKEVNCPVCNNFFNTKKVRTSAIRVIKRDEDFCPYYKEQNPLFYNVFVCPNCGYSNLESGFGNINEKEKEIIRKTITPKWKQRSYGEDRSLSEAMEVYKLALVGNQILNASSRVIGKLCLRLSWLYRYLKDEKEIEFLNFTINSFHNAFTNERLDKEEQDEVVFLYLLGELNRRVENHKEAIKWFDKALSHPNINMKRHIKIKARNQWSLTREEYNKKKKE